MSMQPELPLIDIHEPLAPPWWPPAPGWWIVAGVIVLCLLWLAWRRWRRRVALRRAAELFDRSLSQAATPAARIAAMSELLRRAARRRDPAADRLQGEDWLRFLDRDSPQPVFVDGVGRALLEAAFRRDPGGIDIDALERAARARFLDWMASP
jgi:hypothetical protein